MYAGCPRQGFQQVSWCEDIPGLHCQPDTANCACLGDVQQLVQHTLQGRLPGRLYAQSAWCTQAPPGQIPFHAIFTASEVSGLVKSQAITSYNHKLKQATVSLFVDSIQTQ